MTRPAPFPAPETLTQFGRFLVVGGINTLFGYGVFFVTYTATQSTIAAPVVATIAGVLFNFLTTGSWVFGGLRSGLFWPFVLVYGVQVCANIAGLQVLTALGLGANISQLLLLPVLAVGSFWGLRRFVFRVRLKELS